MRKLLTALLTILCLTIGAQGAVVLHDTNDFTVPGSSSTPAPNPSVEASDNFTVSASTTSNSIVGVFIGLQDYNAVTYDTVTLQGQDMNVGIADFASGDQRGAFFWLETQVIGDNQIVIETSGTSGNQRGMDVQAFVLNNVDTNINPVTSTATLGSDEANTTLDLTLTPAKAGSGVLGFGIHDSSPASVNVTSSYFGSVSSLDSGGYFASKVGVPGTSQAVQFSVVDSRDNQSDQSAAMAVAFSPIPEPSAATLLLGTAGILLLLRRRRA